MKRATLKQEVIDIFKRKKSVKPPFLQGKWRIKRIPDVKPLPLKVGALIFGGLTVLGIAIGATIGTYVFFGTITLTGLIAIAESNKYVRYAIVRSNKALDLAIFGLTIFATISLGITMTASLTYAGLGYTLVYAPWLRLNSK